MEAGRHISCQPGSCASAVPAIDRFHVCGICRCQCEPADHRSRRCERRHASRLSGKSDGSELWAFIPPDFLDSLKDLTARSATHEFYLDSSPIVADIKIGGVWKTIVVFGERRGGMSITRWTSRTRQIPSYLWSFTDSKMGETWSEPAIGKVKMSDGTTKYRRICWRRLRHSAEQPSRQGVLR